MTTVAQLGGWADSSGSGLMFRNKIINGNFNIWQRGTSFSSPASYTYTADRWITDGAATSVSRLGSQNNVLSIVTQAGTGIAQRIETDGGNFYAGQVYTVSALVNCTNADLTINVTYRQGNTFKAAIHTANVSSQVVTGQYTKVSTTFTLPNSPTDFANTNCIQVSFLTTAVNTINFQNVQMEAGSQATPFEQRPIGMELALCQRYLPAIIATSASNANMMSAYTQSANTFRAVVVFKVPTRVPVTSVTVSSAAHFACSFNGGGQAVSAIAFAGGGSESCTIDCTVGSATLNLPGNVYSNNASAKLLFEGAEL